MTEASEIEDPFEGVDEDADEFATARREWLDLAALDERLVMFVVKKIGEKKGQDGPYEYVEADVIVCDGEPLGELLPTVPYTVAGMHINATGVVDQLKEYAGKAVPFLARLDSVPSKRNKNIKVMGVRKHEVTPADKLLARPLWRQYKQDNRIS